jgi:NAD(P)-dependent dehydrogenase (short-subunit alcohol dehydrogenase family)
MEVCSSRRWHPDNTVHLVIIDTPLWTKLSGSRGRNVPVDPKEVAKAGLPLGRAGQAQDIANGVLFLASDASDYMTGRSFGSQRYDRRRIPRWS